MKLKICYSKQLVVGSYLLSCSTAYRERRLYVNHDWMSKLNLNSNLLLIFYWNIGPSTLNSIAFPY